MKSTSKNLKRSNEETWQGMVSLKTLAKRLDAHRSSVRRWLAEANIQPVALGNGRNGAIRYQQADINRWLESLQTVN